MVFNRIILVLDKGARFEPKEFVEKLSCGDGIFCIKFESKRLAPSRACILLKKMSRGKKVVEVVRRYTNTQFRSLARAEFDRLGRKSK